MLQKPLWVLFCYLLFIILAANYAQSFRLDASADSLVLENDASLDYYREITKRYGSDDFVIITFAPNTGLFAEESLAAIESIKTELLRLDNIESVTSILDVPIIYQSGLSLSELQSTLPMLSNNNVDIALAKEEFQHNPLYQNLLVSNDGKITAIQALFKRHNDYYDLLDKRDAAREKGEDLTLLNQQISVQNRLFNEQREIDIAAIRAIIDNHREFGQLYLGGIPMITVDMLQFIQNDLIVFGSGIVLFLIIILTLFFHSPRWVILPLLVCSITGLITTGILGFNDWPVTVISSNFLSILLIITLSLNIHLIVRYRDLQMQHPALTHNELIQATVASMVRPCFYTVLTTAVAFASLVISEIRPVIDFGWIMVIGLSVAFVVSFTFMPALLSLFGEMNISTRKNITRAITLWLAKKVDHHPKLIVALGITLIVSFALGIPELKVENRFINNFKSDTEIYQGLQIIDHQLGGTMPLDLIIDPDRDFIEVQQELAETDSELDALFFDADDSQPEPSYWLNADMIRRAQQVNDYLSNVSSMGKVLSIVTTMDIVEKLNGQPLDDFELAVINNRVPQSIADDMIRPYLSEDNNQARFSMRVIESDPNLNRDQMLKDIDRHLTEELGFEKDQVQLTGMLVLYNNMLQSLFRSQILTIGAVFAAILFMFIILFRNLALSLIAIIPNIFSAALILGLMGYLAIPLDMMTITIAAITIGISVDDTIHYIHRLQQEFPVDHNYLETINRCHGGIGKAMYYTSTAIIFGFALLAFSNFIPTIYFGLLTGFAMFVALLGDLLLVPALVLLLKPPMH